MFINTDKFGIIRINFLFKNIKNPRSQDCGKREEYNKIMQENLKKKYDITGEELKRAIDQINLGKIACDGIVLVALVDLLVNGDIAEEK